MSLFSSFPLKIPALYVKYAVIITPIKVKNAVIITPNKVNNAAKIIGEFSTNSFPIRLNTGGDVGVIFNGSGFYETDYKRKGK